MEHGDVDVRTLREQYASIQAVNRDLRNETAMYESFRDRRLKGGEAEALEADFVANKSKKRKGAKLSRPTELTADQRVDIATNEAEGSKKDTQQMIAEAQRTFDMLKALLQQAQMRTIELRKEAHEFRRDVVLAGENPRNGTVLAEKVIAYYEDNLRRRDNIVDKLRLKAAALKQQELKLQVSLESKDEVGDVLHYIDFHQLQIENNQAISSLEERNTELMRLKLTTGATVGTLNALKARLSTLVKQVTQLKSDIAQRRAMSGKLREENAAMSIVVDAARTVHDTLVVQAREARDMPQPIDYVELTRTQAVLNKELGDWRRKVEIADMSQTRAAAKMRGALATGALDATTTNLLLASGASFVGTRMQVITDDQRTAEIASLTTAGARTDAVYASSTVTASVVGSLPGSTRPVGFGSTTMRDGTTGVRPVGTLAGTTVHDLPHQRGTPAVQARIGGGFTGSMSRHTQVADQTQAGASAVLNAGTLRMGRPETLQDTERKKAQVLASQILGRRDLPAGLPFK